MEVLCKTTFEGEDSATGQKRVIVTCSLQTPTGPHSFLMEFDVRTKLPVSMKIWRNLKQEGAPDDYFEKLVYFEDLPDSAFNFQPPEGTPFTDMPLTVPEASLSTLGDPKNGISAEGMTREQACREILEQLYAVRKNSDLAEVAAPLGEQLSPQPAIATIQSWRSLQRNTKPSFSCSPFLRCTH